MLLFNCKSCSSTFLSRKDLLAHAKVHGENMCSACNKHFSDPEEFRKHIESHYGNIHLCSICEQGFLSELSLRKHKDYLHTANNTHFCHICNEHFSFYNTFKLHLLSHRGTSKLKVPKEFTDWIKTHHRKYVCNICNFSTVRLPEAVLHIKTHSRVKDARSCLTCGKEFLQIKLLYNHKRIHGTRASAPIRKSKKRPKVPDNGEWGGQ